MVKKWVLLSFYPSSTEGYVDDSRTPAPTTTSLDERRSCKV